jgi:transcription termination/antitermination protein NusA
VEKLSAAGITTVEALADMTPEQLEAIEGIGPKTVEKISLAVNNYFASLEGGSEEGVVAAEEEAPAELEAGAEEAPAEVEAGTEEAAVEAAAEEDATAPGESAGAEAASEEKEHEPQGSAPETTE